MATKKTSVNPEFLYVPVANIVVLEQVRSNVNIETDSFKALVQSIKDKGILEPLLVTKGDGDSYTLICGERRLEAARQLGHEFVPVRVIEAGKESGETIALQLTENLQREDLNPIDQAKGILSLIQAKLPDKNYDVDGVMSEMVRYTRKPETLPEEVVKTVLTIGEIVGKSIMTLYNGLSLLKLSDEIQMAISGGTLQVSQGYLFAANLDCPDRGKIFEAIMKTPVTNATLNNLLTAYKKVKPAPGKTKPLPMKKQIAGLRSVESRIEMGIATYTRPDLETLLDELHVFCALVELRIPIAPEPAPEKPVKKQPML
ncbi:MAG: ParB/RepB/Spo0J family partition protein [Proteobacteria bacterium]|nr:ParB/RepB/Spo0J family partition protein [Pseudomonadota bacterium]